MRNKQGYNRLSVIMKNLFSKDNLNPQVFFGSAAVIFLITAFGAIWPKSMEAFFKQTQAWLITNTSWVYILAVAVITFFSFGIIFSRMGDIKLGPDHEEPEYGNVSWFSMLFSAGMGIGLLFFGVAEPVMHFSTPPVGPGGTPEAAQEAMKITFFHWGLHAWAIYATLAVILAYFAYRKNLPLLPRSAFYPLIGDKIHGKIGNMIDTFAIIGTMFGVATSLGYGVTQVNAGLNYLFDLPISTTVQVLLIIGITAMATISVVLGLDGGIKKLSNINMALAVGLLLAVLFLGSSMGLMKDYVQNTGAYLSDLIYKTFNLYAYEKKETWFGGWTLLYWAWWISWSPFVGIFIARISKGRTIREFMCGALFVPAAFTFLWMTVFGNSAISLALSGHAQDLVHTISNNVPVALFKFFEYFPFSSFLSMLGVMLIITFFVSSSDSGSLVIDTLASGGLEEPPVWQRVFWAVLEGLVAAVLLYAGGLGALQTMTIVSAFPMIFLILISLFSFIRTLRADYLLQNSILSHSTSVQYSSASMPWQDRVKHLSRLPSQTRVRTYLKDVAFPAMDELQKELRGQGYETELTFEQDKLMLSIDNSDEENFHYEIHVRRFNVPEYVNSEREAYCRAEVFLLNGGQDYDVFGYPKEQLIADAICQYEKHYHFLHKLTSEQAE
ncbi:choline transporter [Fulvitalea axinellae]|uniref:Choline transporter n=1 Tax=Fulvitalea axinellae TaxID=1182444 RepID=A0AAU9CSH9_9BACT|nr:choline transporter [Fulvitalea axinellae]